MFCEKCGTQVAEDQAFCPNCGNQLASASAQQSAAQPAAAGARQLKLDLSGMTKNEQYFLFGTLGALLLGLIFSLLPTVSVRASAFGQTMAQSGSFGEMQASYVTILIILGNLAAAALLLLPLLGLLKKNLNFYLIAAGCAGLGAILTIIAWISASSQIRQLMGMGSSLGLGSSVSASAGLSVLGWLLLIFQLGAAGLCVYMYLNEKKKG